MWYNSVACCNGIPCLRRWINLIFMSALSVFTKHQRILNFLYKHITNDQMSFLKTLSSTLTPPFLPLIRTQIKPPWRVIFTICNSRLGRILLLSYMKSKIYSINDIKLSVVLDTAFYRNFAYNKNMQVHLLNI